MKNQNKTQRPKQEQNRPGVESEMNPVPITTPIYYPPEGKLYKKNVVITGGDSGIGKAIALLFAKEGANIFIVYLSEVKEAKQTKEEVKAYGVNCFIKKADLSKELNCKKVVQNIIDSFGSIDILINNAGLHWESKSLAEITTKQWLKTFENNIHSYFWMTKFILPYLKKGDCIINTTSVTAYRGSDSLIDYASTKGAIVSFTRSLSANLIKDGIRVNAVAPGPVWTPLIASSFNKSKVATFGTQDPMGRAAMPNEIAPSYLFLASKDSQFISGQVIHPNGGEIING